MKSQFLAIGLVLGIMGTGLHAQNTSAMITQGEKADFYIIVSAAGVKKVALSPDGKYMGGGADAQTGREAPGIIYGFEKDTTWLTESPAVFILSPDHYAGGGYIWRDGKALEVETYGAGGSSIWAASASLDTLFSMSYETEKDPFDGKTLQVNYAYLIDGKTGKIMQRVKPCWPMSSERSNQGFGERVNGVSADGKVLAGNGFWPGVSTWAPVIWDLEHDTALFAGTEDWVFGTLNCVSDDGTVIGGGSGLIHYDREDMTLRRESIPLAPGNTGSSVVDIKGGWALLYQESSTGRDGYLYNLEDGTLVSLSEYMEELYGLKSPIPYYTPMSMSEDGRTICGYSTYMGSFVPYCVKLGESQILARPRDFFAAQAYEGMTVEMHWIAPLKGQYTLKGYNVYCDSVQLNAELVPATETSWLQTEGVEAGVHDYAVQAVYEEGVSAYSEPVKLYIVEDDGCFPVQEIGSHITYNRHVDVWWGLPSARMTQSASRAKSSWDGTLRAPVCGERRSSGLDAKSYVDTGLDLISYSAFETFGFSSVLLENSRLYVGKYQSAELAVYDYPSMELLSTHKLQGISGIYNMTMVGDKIYLVTNSEEILIVDKATLTVSNRLPVGKGEKLAHICYIPDLNQGQGGLAYGSWTSLHFCTLEGDPVELDAEIDISFTSSISGSAYHKGRLYLANQTDNRKDVIYTLDFATGKVLSAKVLAEDVRLEGIEPTYGFVTGGLSCNLLSDSTVALAVVLQYSAADGHVAFLEAESAPGRLGYNLYRNGVKLNPDGEYIQGLAYEEDLLEPGTYTYKVEAVSKDCHADTLPGVETKVVINPIGDCASPVNITAVESNHSVMLEWEYAGIQTGPGLVGFDIYRNEELISEKLLDLRFTDHNVAKGDYVYRIEAFHENSCLRKDSAEVKVTYEGVAMPPSAFSVEPVERGADVEVEAAWDLPYYEHPFALGYCGMPYSAIALTGTSVMYAAIGWDAEGLAPFKDLYLVGVEYFIGTGFGDVAGVVFVNDTLAYEKPVSGRVQETAWNTLMFDEYIPMNQPDELVVGYRAEFEEGANAVAAFDMGPGKKGYSDLVSGDGVNWSTLAENKLDYNWCINALVVSKRDLETAKSSGNGMLDKALVKRMSMEAMPLCKPVAVDKERAKATSESVKLVGFNVYRDENKLNGDLLRDLSYTDAEVSGGGYDYKVSAVYADGSEAFTDLFYVEVPTANEEMAYSAVGLSPNPASDVLHIAGSWRKLDIFSLDGHSVTHYEGGQETIGVEMLASGVYMLRFTLPDGSICIEKLVVRR